MAFKHYEFQSRYFHGYKIHRLLSLDDSSLGVEYLPYTSFMEGLVLEGLGINTIKNYGYSLAQFLNYLQEGERYFKGINTDILRKLIIGYHSYLIYGKKAEDADIRSIAIELSVKTVKPQTAALYHASIKRFIQESDEYHLNLMDLVKVGLLNSSDLDSETLFYSGLPRASLPLKQQQAINNYSVIAAVVHGGARMKHKSLFRHLPSISSTDDEYDEYKHFALDKIPLVIKEASSERNATLWALIAATGLRPIEALQVLWEDIDMETLDVYAINPLRRKKPAESYKGLSEIERNRLTWKARKTKHTLMLEPYATLFFEYLSKYIASSKYIHHGRHNFIFQTEKGRPLYLSDYGSVVLEPFHAAQKRLVKNKDITERRGLNSLESQGGTNDNQLLGLHSLRHSFCFFLKNYVQSPDGRIGFTDYQIMAITGHKDVRSTAKYAKLDKEKLRAIMTYANNIVLGEGVKSSDEYHLDYLIKEVGKVKERLKLESQGDSCSGDLK